MKIVVPAIETITSHARFGRITLQVPNIVLGAEPKHEDVPDEYFCHLNGYLPSTPAYGFLFLTRRGWGVYKDALTAAYVKTCPKVSVSEYHAAIEAEFCKRKTALDKEIAKLQKKIAKLKALQKLDCN